MLELPPPNSFLGSLLERLPDASCRDLLREIFAIDARARAETWAEAQTLVDQARVPTSASARDLFLAQELLVETVRFHATEMANVSATCQQEATGRAPDGTPLNADGPEVDKAPE